LPQRRSHQGHCDKGRGKRLSREIEEFPYTHPDIQDIQVIGVPDPKYGEELCVWIVPKRGAVLDAEGIRAFCKGRIAHRKVPRHVRVVKGFPTTVAGKVQKFAMREVIIEELNRDRSRG